MRPVKKDKSPRKPVAHLGDTDTTDEDEYEFQSPQPDNDATDYGLEFSTSRLRIAERERRCSTLRKKAPQQSHSETDQENRLPESTRHTRSQGSIVTAPSLQQQQPQQQQRRTRQRSRKQYRPKRGKMSMEILRLQQTPNLLIPHLPFSRLVREILIANSIQTLRITSTALEALQYACELYMTQRFQDAYMLTCHRGRVTLEVRDMALVSYFCKARGEI